MAHKNRQIVFLCREGEGMNVGIVGKKGAGLIEMRQSGLPVPPHVLVASGVSRAILQEGWLPKRLAWQLRRTVVGNKDSLQHETGRVFGGSRKPLLVAVRSGAAVSMPGMMETIPNLGLNPETVRYLIAETDNSNFVHRCYLAFLKKFGALVQGVARRDFDEIEKIEQDLAGRIELFRKLITDQAGEVVDDVWRQLEMAIEAICLSWNTERAKEYRRIHKISDKLGTAVVIQAMVFGNKDDRSGTGVAFSRSPSTGKREFYGEFLRNAQGDDLVGGGVTPQPIAVLSEEFPEVAEQLKAILLQQEQRRFQIVEVEFTVESGKLWLLQVRRAKTATEADLRFVIDLVDSGRMTQREALQFFTEGELSQFVVGQRAFEEEEVARLISQGQFLKGLPASPGIAQGEVCFSVEKALARAEAGAAVILVRPDTSPEDFAAMIRSQAIITAKGGETCHAAVVARGQRIPAVVSVAGLATSDWIIEGQEVSIDGGRGLVFPGRLLITGSEPNANAVTLLRWFKEEWERKVDFSLVSNLYCMNTALNDFYLADAALFRALGSDLEDECRKLTEKIHRQTAQVIATYLTFAVAGELRHAVGHLSANELEELELRVFCQPGIVGQLGQLYCDRDVAQKLALLLEKGGQEALISFHRIAKSAFARVEGNIFCGKSWAEIADAVLYYLEGRVGPTVFVDRAFDLRHNGGLLFNKHPMTDFETKENSLRRQLDVKRRESDLGKLYEQLLVVHKGLSPEVAELARNVLDRTLTHCKESV